MSDLDDADLGNILRDEGMALAAEAQEGHAWTHELGLFAIRKCAEMYEFLDSDSVHQYLHEHRLPEPEHANAWGAVWKQARKDRLIEEAFDQPRRKSKRWQAHSKPMTRYRSLLGGGF